MADRDLCLAVYDVADPGWLRAGLALAKGYATGGQGVAQEISLTATEKLQPLT